MTTSCVHLLVCLVLTTRLVSTQTDTHNSLIVVDQTSDDNDVRVESEVEEEVAEETEPFIASKEWQPILKGQVIPAGLHVRLNLETGLREAKILDTNTRDMDNRDEVMVRPKKAVENRNIVNSKVKAIRRELKEMLRNMKSDDFVDEIESSEKSLKDFRSMDEIRKDFDEMDVKIRSETEILKSLISRYKEASIEEKLNLLSDVEYLVHSIDIAKDLIQMNAIDLLLPDLNSTDHRLRSQIALTMGSAMNGNPSVQMHVFEKSALKDLLFILQNDGSVEVKKKMFYAISCLVRQLPRVQKSLIKQYDALFIFAQLFKQSDIQSIKLNTKIITLLNDLLIERQMALKYATNDRLSQIKAKQYEDIGLIESIVSHRFCDLMSDLLNCPDNDVREKTIEAMDSLSIICKQEFQKSLSILKQISDDLLNETKKDTFNNYFTYLYQLTSNLINKLTLDLKDEL